MKSHLLHLQNSLQGTAIESELSGLVAYDHVSHSASLILMIL